MNKARRLILSTTIAGTMLLGGGATAFAHGDSTPKDRTAHICSHRTQIAKQLNNRKAAAEKRIKNLQKALDRAKAAGHKQAAARLERALTRAQNHLARINARIAKLAAFVAANC